MKILLLTTHLNIGGIATYVVTLAKALKAKGEEVIVLSSGGILVSELTALGISHIALDIQTKSELSPKIFKAIFEIAKLVRKLDIDIIHSQTRVTQVISFFVSRLCKVGFITTCHGFFRKNIARLLLPAWGERIIAISPAVERHLLEYFHIPRSKITLIYNGIYVNGFLRNFSDEEKNGLREKFGIKKDTNVIGTIGRFTADKGQDLLLYTFRDILKQEPDVQLILVGDGREYSKQVNLSERLGISEKVLFIKPQVNTVDILSILDIFMFTPKRKEGLGIVLLEALAGGKPVIGTDVGGISSVIKDGINGFLIDPSNPELLVNRTLKLLRDRQLCQKMAQAGREMVIERFSVDGMVKKVRETYIECQRVREERKTRDERRLSTIYEKKIYSFIS